MAVFGSGGSRSLGGRGPSFGFRFFCYALLSVVLMFYDRRGGWLDTARYGLQAAVYPLQLAVNSPSAAWRWLEESFATRESLQAEIETLRMQLREQQLATLRQAALEAENAALRGLNQAFPDVIERKVIGEVISVEVSTLRQRLVVNRGGRDGVNRAQPVVTGDGVLGQVFRTGPFSSEIILITDAEHALPVQVVRSGVRTIALGTGRSTALELPYVPQNYDVQVGDVLVTSGLGRVFPFGLPVAKVASVERDPTQPLARIIAEPLARVESDREVLFIWSRPDHPAAPASEAALTVAPEESARKPAPKPAPKPARKPTDTPASPAPADPQPGNTPPADTSPAGPSPTNAPPASPPAATPPSSTPSNDTPANPPANPPANSPGDPPANGPANGVAQP